MMDKASATKVFRIVENEKGHAMKRVFKDNKTADYTDQEMSLEERYEFDQLYDVPH